MKNLVSVFIAVIEYISPSFQNRYWSHFFLFLMRPNLINLDTAQIKGVQIVISDILEVTSSQINPFADCILVMICSSATPRMLPFSGSKVKVLRTSFVEVFRSKNGIPLFSLKQCPQALHRRRAMLFLPYLSLKTIFPATFFP
jgi:hypothetical protein